MSSFKQLEDIKVYNEARLQAKDIWLDLKRKKLYGNDFGLIDQINRSSGSVMDNVAEGHGRGGTREFITFLGYARGSNEEVKSQIQRAFDREYYDQETYDLKIKANKLLSIKISNLIKYLRKTTIKGNKWFDDKNKGNNGPIAEESRATYFSEIDLMNIPIEDLDDIYLPSVEIPAEFFAQEPTN